MSGRFQPRHLLGIEGLAQSDVLALLDGADAFFEISRRPVRKVPTLRGKTIINVFFEASTRTRTSFELAGKRLSADVVNISASTSSVTKGETLADTMATLEAMRSDVLVIRHPASGAAQYVAEKLDALALARPSGLDSSRVVNAGDGLHEHPTQALLDAFTIRRHFLRTRPGAPSLDGLTVAICGDVSHSRVARSNAHLLNLFGCKVRFAAPRTLLPAAVESLGVEVFDRVEGAIEGADVVMILRIQRERIEGALLPSLREYARTFGIGERALRAAKPDALVMHPGPMNRGVEISAELADGPRSAVLDQVEAGVAVRMSVLYHLAADPGEVGA
jgi:aspartate carbamoyltransferase catalytic subunit